MPGVEVPVRELDPISAEEAIEGAEEPTGEDMAKASQVQIGRPRVVLYETRTGEPRQINHFNVAEVLKKKHKDPAYPEFIGKPLFSKVKTKEFVLGTHKCWLHPSQPRAQEYARRGFLSCPAEHIASEEDVRRHMKAKHKNELARMDEERAERERREDRALQRQQMEALLAVANGNGRAMTGASGVGAPPVRHKGGRPRKIVQSEGQSNPEN